MSILGLVLMLTLLTVATPATAGQLGGTGFPPALQPGECAYTVTTMNPEHVEHFFVARGTGSDSHRTSNPGNQQAVGNVIVVGPLKSVSDEVVADCQFLPN